MAGPPLPCSIVTGSGRVGAALMDFRPPLEAHGGRH